MGGREEERGGMNLKYDRLCVLLLLYLIVFVNGREEGSEGVMTKFGIWCEFCWWKGREEQIWNRIGLSFIGLDVSISWWKATLLVCFLLSFYLVVFVIGREGNIWNRMGVHWWKEKEGHIWKNDGTFVYSDRCNGCSMEDHTSRLFASFVVFCSFCYCEEGLNLEWCDFCWWSGRVGWISNRIVLTCIWTDAVVAQWKVPLLICLLLLLYSGVAVILREGGR